MNEQNHGHGPVRGGGGRAAGPGGLPRSLPQPVTGSTVLRSADGRQFSSARNFTAGGAVLAAVGPGRSRVVASLPPRSNASAIQNVAFIPPSGTSLASLLQGNGQGVTVSTRPQQGLSPSVITTLQSTLGKCQPNLQAKPPGPQGGVKQVAGLALGPTSGGLRGQRPGIIVGSGVRMGGRKPMVGSMPQSSQGSSRATVYPLEQVHQVLQGKVPAMNSGGNTLLLVPPQNVRVNESGKSPNTPQRAPAPVTIRQQNRGPVGLSVPRGLTPVVLSAPEAKSPPKQGGDSIRLALPVSAPQSSGPAVIQTPQGPLNLGMLQWVVKQGVQSQPQGQTQSRPQTQVQVHTPKPTPSPNPQYHQPQIRSQMGGIVAGPSGASNGSNGGPGSNVTYAPAYLVQNPEGLLHFIIGRNKMEGDSTADCKGMGTQGQSVRIATVDQSGAIQAISERKKQPSPLQSPQAVTIRQAHGKPTVPLQIPDQGPIIPAQLSPPTKSPQSQGGRKLIVNLQMADARASGAEVFKHRPAVDAQPAPERQNRPDELVTPKTAGPAARTEKDLMIVAESLQGLKASPQAAEEEEEGPRGAPKPEVDKKSEEAEAAEEAEEPSKDPFMGLNLLLDAATRAGDEDILAASPKFSKQPAHRSDPEFVELCGGSRRSPSFSSNPPPDTALAPPEVFVVHTEFRGVTPVQGSKYIARCRFKGGSIQIGIFERAEDAARAYDRVVLSLRGPNAKTNFSRDEYLDFEIQNSKRAFDFKVQQAKQVRRGSTWPWAKVAHQMFGIANRPGSGLVVSDQGKEAASASDRVEQAVAVLSAMKKEDPEVFEEAVRRVQGVPPLFGSEQGLTDAGSQPLNLLNRLVMEGKGLEEALEAVEKRVGELQKNLSEGASRRKENESLVQYVYAAKVLRGIMSTRKDSTPRPIAEKKDSDILMGRPVRGKSGDHGDSSENRPKGGAGDEEINCMPLATSAPGNKRTTGVPSTGSEALPIPWQQRQSGSIPFPLLVSPGASKDKSPPRGCLRQDNCNKKPYLKRGLSQEHDSEGNGLSDRGPFLPNLRTISPSTKTSEPPVVIDVPRPTDRERGATELVWPVYRQGLNFPEEGRERHPCKRRGGGLQERPLKRRSTRMPVRSVAYRGMRRGRVRRRSLGGLSRDRDLTVDMGRAGLGDQKDLAAVENSEVAEQGELERPGSTGRCMVSHSSSGDGEGECGVVLVNGSELVVQAAEEEEGSLGDGYFEGPGPSGDGCSYAESVSWLKLLASSLWPKKRGGGMLGKSFDANFRGARYREVMHSTRSMLYENIAFDQGGSGDTNARGG